MRKLLIFFVWFIVQSLRHAEFTEPDVVKKVKMKIPGWGEAERYMTID